MLDWRVRVDVGGTFTDGWALSPRGEQLKCKVLSSGVVRLEVVSNEEGWLFCGKSIGPQQTGLEGFRTRDGYVVVESNPKEGRLRLSEQIDLRGDLELFTGEESAVVATRLLTGVGVGGEFPALDLRVATTRATNALLEGKGQPVDLITTKGFEDLLKIRDQRRPDIFELSPQFSIPITRKIYGIQGRFDRQGHLLESLSKEDLEGIDPKRAVAVALIHSDCCPNHELEIAEVLAKKGCENVSLSHQLAPMIRLWPRMETAVANAYLSPIIFDFIKKLREAFTKSPVSLMTSSGHLKAAEGYRPIDSLLSGPAGGVSGAYASALSAGLSNVLTFDMGGTSTDVARISGRPRYRYEQEVGPVKVLTPAIKIETVAAGGGSICQFRNGGLEVGPESAGSNPGPACYGRGGPLTITDVNLLLGLMDEKKAGIPLIREDAEARLQELCQEIGAHCNPQNLLQGLRHLAISQMADALRLVSTREGYDSRRHSLIAFGGAGPQHACSLATELGIEEILIPGNAGLLSAWGLDQSGDRTILTEQLLVALDEEDVGARIEKLCGAAQIHRCLFELRLFGQDSCLEIESEKAMEASQLRELFFDRYLDLYGYQCPRNRRIEWVTLRVEVGGQEQFLSQEEFSDDEAVDELRVEQDCFSTLVIEPGWVLSRGSLGSVRLRWSGCPKAPVNEVARVDVVEAELFRRRFEGIVSEMGELLRRTALSTNIKERLDYSCALLDQNGFLVVNAPHIPVHLGALGLCVRMVSESWEWRKGDCVVVNHPAFGGSHLPDVTLITPVFLADELIAFVANRAHHAEIGGQTPGSMPPNATCLAQEGVVIAPTRYEDLDLSFFAQSRAPADNIADLAAQFSANEHGVAEMEVFIRNSGVESVKNHMGALFQRSAMLMEEALANFREGRATDYLDDGSAINVHLYFKEKLFVDFSGSSPTHQQNLNATPAIVRSAVLYALRLWVNEDIPLNEGLLKNVEILTEEGILAPNLKDDPTICPAVVGGNVETSQRLVDVLLEALGIQSNGQGTMNNFLFGNERFGFYETIGGGAGAGPSWHGRSGCHVHMSNTAITDAEILEQRYPVRLRNFSLRKNSGGEGLWKGGDGLIREIEFLEEMTVSLLSQRRNRHPRPNGQPGAQFLLRDGSWKELPGIISLKVNPGERLRIETPGGGGWLQPSSGLL